MEESEHRGALSDQTEQVDAMGGVTGDRTMGPGLHHQNPVRRSIPFHVHWLELPHCPLGCPPSHRFSSTGSHAGHCTEWSFHPFLLMGKIEKPGVGAVTVTCDTATEWLSTNEDAQSCLPLRPSAISGHRNRWWKIGADLLTLRTLCSYQLEV